MRCYYTFHNREKILIPGCYSVIHSDDISDCNCGPPITEHHFAKERFNKILKEKDEFIEQLLSENKHLFNQLEKVYKKPLKLHTAMEYKGEIFGKVGKSYFPLSANTDDIHNMKTLLQQANTQLALMRRSMSAHPDCEEDSEFDGLTSCSQNLEDKISDFLTNTPI